MNAAQVDAVSGYQQDPGAQLDLEAEGEKVLDETLTFIRRFCVLPDEHCLIAVTLWVAHAHMIQHFHTTTRLVLSSPEAGSGKTKVLEVLDLLVPESMMALNASPVTVFGSLATRQITLLFDEVDAIWNSHGKGDTHEDLRALLDAGYKRGAKTPGCVGPKYAVASFKVFCAAAPAGIGDLPDTVMRRAIVLRMRRRAPHEQIEPFRSRTHEPEGQAIRDRLARWAALTGEAIGNSWPKMPDGVVDRPAEVWEPLIAIAEAVGGKWPVLARDACLSLCRAAQDRRASLGVRLLSDLRIIFQNPGSADALHTETIVERLISGDGLEDDAPWADLHGKPLGKRGLASMLAKYHVRPMKVRIGNTALQGCRREDLCDARVRYLPLLCSTSAQPEHPEHSASDRAKLVPGVPEVLQFRTGKGALNGQDGESDELIVWAPPTFSSASIGTACASGQTATR